MIKVLTQGDRRVFFPSDERHTGKQYRKENSRLQSRICFSLTYRAVTYSRLMHRIGRRLNRIKMIQSVAEVYSAKPCIPKSFITQVQIHCLGSYLETFLEKKMS